MTKRAVLITGGSKGIGLAAASRFLALDCQVTISGRSLDHLAEAAASLAEPDRMHFVASDVSTVAGCRRAVDEAVERFGRLDVLLTNAGAYESKSSSSLHLADSARSIHLKATRQLSHTSCDRTHLQLLRCLQRTSGLRRSERKATPSKDRCHEEPTLTILCNHKFPTMTYLATGVTTSLTVAAESRA